MPQPLIVASEPIPSKVTPPPFSLLAAKITVIAHERTGFAFVNGTSSGAYNDDGTLKSDARVIYEKNCLHTHARVRFGARYFKFNAVLCFFCYVNNSRIGF